MESMRSEFFFSRVLILSARTLNWETSTWHKYRCNSTSSAISRARVSKISGLLSNELKLVGLECLVCSDEVVLVFLINCSYHKSISSMYLHEFYSPDFSWPVRTSERPSKKYGRDKGEHKGEQGTGNTTLKSTPCVVGRRQHTFRSGLQDPRGH